MNKFKEIIKIIANIMWIIFALYIIGITIVGAIIHEGIIMTLLYIGWTLLTAGCLILLVEWFEILINKLKPKK